MSTDTDITQDRHDLRALKLLLVATNPRKTLSMHAVAAALGCHPMVIQTLVGQGDIPTSVDGDATPSEPVQIPRSFVATYLYFSKKEDSDEFARRIKALVPLLNPADWNAATAAVEDLTNLLLKP